MFGEVRISRRKFIETAAAGGAAACWGAPQHGMPSRVLGRTGASVSILAFGAGQRFLEYPDEDRALAALSLALDLGINYIDTAYNYGNGVSEKRVGKFIRTLRKKPFLASKVDARNGDKAMRAVETSLKRLGTDHVDLLHIHSLTDSQDLAAIEAADGVLKAVYKLRDQKVARAIGITSHFDPAVLQTALERHDFDCTQMALNAALAGMGDGQGHAGMNPRPSASFQSLALPVALRKNMGVIAMKAFARGELEGKAPAEKLLGYCMTLPVTTCSVGMATLAQIQANVEMVRRFQPLPAAEMNDLAATLSGQHRTKLERFFRDHVDC
jgi:aryl-alcohol dehydrogenase-like predicted oxidoreductase